MTLEVEYKDNRFGYIEMKYVVDIRDFHKKENKYVILSEKEYKKLLEEIEYLKKNPNLFMDLKEYYQNFCTFEHVKDSPHLFDKRLHYNAGEVTEDGKIGFYQQGARNTFFVGLPIYDLQNNKIGNLSYVFKDGWYWWQIVGYKGVAQDIKTYWQVLKEGKIKELEW